MGGMGDWLNNIPVTTPETPGMRTPMVSLPDTPTPAAPEPTAPASTPEAPAPAPTEPEVLPANLRDWLMQYYSGYNVLPQEMYDLFGGDDVLTQIRKFDPNAQWTRTAQWGGEGGDGPMGYRLDFDPSKLPTVGGPGGGRSIFDTGFRPVKDMGELRNAAMTYDDPYFGKLTPYGNIAREKDPWWTIAAPIAVSLLAPYAAGGLAAAGIGAPGLTSAVTGTGLSASAGGLPWWAKAIGKAPSIAKGVVGAATAGAAGGAAAAKPKAPMVPGGYDPTKYNNAGSASKPQSNESSLVANDFSVDPYGFSKGAA